MVARTQHNGTMLQGFRAISLQKSFGVGILPLGIELKCAGLACLKVDLMVSPSYLDLEDIVLISYFVSSMV